MQLIADSGATKTHWVLFDKTEQHQTETIGISPVHSHPSAHYHELRAHFETHLPRKPDKVFFYGAGCAGPQLCEKVAALLADLFPDAQVHVNSDMLGAARGVLGENPGIAGILGTGSNSCLYDGAHITDQIPALGYILGDEGSGAMLGREVLNRYYKRDMPEPLREAFANSYSLDLNEVLPKIYRQERPSRYLAGFSRFVGDNLDNPYMKNLSKEVLGEFFRRNIRQYTNAHQYSVGFAGSVAWYYRHLLQEVADSQGFEISNIVKSPMKGLIRYHSFHLRACNKTS